MHMTNHFLPPKQPQKRRETETTTKEKHEHDHHGNDKHNIGSSVTAAMRKKRSFRLCQGSQCRSELSLEFVQVTL